MLLSNIQTLSSYPFEKIGVLINNTVAPEANMRLGIRFRNSYYPAGDLLLNWNSSLKPRQEGREPDVVGDPLKIKEFVQPTNFVNIPDDFPIYLPVSAIPFHNMLLNFKGGTSAISIFPSTPYPIITKSGNSLSVSGAYLPLTAFNTSINRDQLFATIKPNNLQNLGIHGASLLSPSTFISSHKRDFIWKTVTSNPLTGTIFNNEILPTNGLDRNIIPESFRITFPLSGSTLLFPQNYTLSYANSDVSYHYLSGLPVEVVPLNPIATYARLDAVNARLTMVLNSGYSVPKNSSVLVSYETSGIAVATSTNNGVNGYIVSGDNAPYLFSHQFEVSNAAGTQKAFDISFAPSAINIPYPSSSAYAVSTVMVDNYYQTYFPITENIPIASMKFVENSGDLSLSAQDAKSGIIYGQNSWYPASATTRFINNGFANSHTVTMQLSTVKNAIYDITPFTFILNKNLALINVSLLNSTDLSANVIANVFPTYDTNRLVRWDVSPSENIKLTEIITNRDITPGVLAPAGLLNVNVTNLGIDNTTISVYSEEFDTSGFTVWQPSSAVFSNITLAISGDVNDFYKIKSNPISAVFSKQGLIYPVPQNAMISWKDDNSDTSATKGVLNFSDNNGNHVFENVVYPATRNYSNLVATISTRNVNNNPEQIIFNVQTNVFSNAYNFVATKTLYAREYPNVNIYGTLSSSDGQVISTYDREGAFFTSAVNITAVADLQDLNISSASNIKWVHPDGSVHTGLSTVFSLSSAYCMGISAISAQPINGGFGFYDFSDSICFNVFSGPPPALDFIAFPEYKFFPTTKLAISDNSYTTSDGVSGLSGISTQNFIVSTFAGFDSYIYRIGNKTVNSNNNVVTIPIQPSDITPNGNISISAFDTVFAVSDLATIYNSVSSDNSTKFKQSVKFYPTHTLSGSLSIDRTEFNLQNPSAVTFTDTLVFVPSSIDVQSLTYSYILSSMDDIRYSIPTLKQGSGLHETYSFTFNPANFFHIPANTYNTYQLFVSGMANVITPLNGVLQAQSFLSNQVAINVYDGIDANLLLFIPNNITRTNTPIYFVNETSNAYPTKYDHFIFDDGAGNYQTAYTYNTTFTGLYLNTGVYSPSMTGVSLTGNTLIHTWADTIVVKDTYTAYSSAITRQFPSELVLPYSCDEVKISPNSWQHASVINNSFAKIKDNISFLNNATSAYDINIPKNYVGWLAEKNGTLNWHQSDEIVESLYPDVLANIKDMVFVDDKIILVNGSNIEIFSNDYNLTLLYSSNKITEGEIFEKPVRLVYNTKINKLIVLDNIKSSVFVFDIVNDTLDLTHYWGGVGDRTSRTKLNNATDLAIDKFNTMYIVDSDSNIVKLYNNYLNWFGSIEHSEWTNGNNPISISTFNNDIFVLSSNGTVYVFSDKVFSYKFHGLQGNRLIVNADSEGLLYILTDTNTHAFTFNGIYLNALLNPSVPMVSMTFKDGHVYATSKNTIYKLIDYIDVQTVKKNNLFTASAWNWSSIDVSESEPVTDYIFNDSFKKINDNIFLLGKDVNDKFTVELDEFGDFVSHSTSTLLNSERILSANSFTPLGINELVTYETINRPIEDICIKLESLKSMLEVRETGDFDVNKICWTWKNLRIDNPQKPNNNRRPFAWIEMRSDIGTINIKWKDAMTCGGETNTFPICWTWDSLACENNCFITWENDLHQIWDNVKDNCCTNPSEVFDNCVETC